MLEHVPAWLGQALRGLRAGADALVIARPGLAPGGDHEAGAGFATLTLTSPAFAHEARLPPRFTADGAGISPPLLWDAPPPGTAALALIVEDADALALGDRAGHGLGAEIVLEDVEAGLSRD